MAGHVERLYHPNLGDLREQTGQQCGDAVADEAGIKSAPVQRRAALPAGGLDGGGPNHIRMVVTGKVLPLGDRNTVGPKTL